MTNDINELQFDSILMDLKASNTVQILQKLSEHTARLIGTPKQLLMDHLQNQEQSSGIGGGVAISHMRLPRLTKPLIIFVKLSNNVDFKAMDGEPVDLVCLVLSPEFEGPKHLSRLAKVSRFFSSHSFCEQLREAQDKDDVRLALKNINMRRIAA